jgi:hypothetical protein
VKDSGAYYKTYSVNFTTFLRLDFFQKCTISFDVRTYSSSSSCVWRVNIKSDSVIPDLHDS